MVSNIPSVRSPSEEDIQESTMAVYRKNFKTTNSDGVAKLATKLKFVPACILVSTQPKIMDAVENAEVHAAVANVAFGRQGPSKG